MNPNDEKFTINWEDLKFLIEYANQGVIKIKGLEGKFDYKTRVQRDRQAVVMRRREEEERKEQEELKPIKTKILELSTKFSRLFIKEIAEECKIKRPGLIRRAIEDMIEKNEINAKYFASSESVVFELK